MQPNINTAISKQNMRLDAQPDEYGFVPDVEPQYSGQPEQKSTMPINNNVDEYGFIPDNTEQNLQEGQTKPKYSTIERLMQVGRGVTNTYGSIADLFNRYIAANVGDLLLSDLPKGVNPDEAKKTVEELRSSHIREDLAGKWNKWAGKDLAPADKTGRILEGVGEFAAPLPIPMGGAAVKGGTALVKGAIKGNSALVKAGAKRLSDIAAKNLARSSGASGLMNFADSNLIDAKEHPYLDWINKTLEAVVGGVLGEKAYGGAKLKIMQSLAKTTGKYVNFSKEQKKQIETMAKQLTKKEALEQLGSPNMLQRAAGTMLAKTIKPKDKQQWLDLIEAAEKEGIELPFNVALGGGKFKNLLANNIFKSMFTHSAYNDVITNADKAMVDKLKNVLETTHPEEILRGEASYRVKDFLRQEKDTIKKTSDELFGYAETLIKPDDKIGLENLTATMKDMKKKIADSPSGDQRFVLKRMLDVADKWKLLPEEQIKKIRLAGDEIEMSPKFMDAIEKHLEKNPEIPLERAISQRKAWHADIDYEKDIPNVRNWMNGLIGSLERDIATSANKEYLTALNAAKSYYKQNMVDRIRTDMASSLLNGEMPKEAFVYMSSPTNVRRLDKILGDTQQAKEIMQALKRAKVNEMLYERAIDGQSALITEGGHIKYGALANNLVKSSNVELLKELLPAESFKQMQRLARISQGIYSAGREIGTNVSVTGIASSDISKFNKIIDGTLSSIFALLEGGGMATGHPVSALPAAVALPAAINQFSKILADKKIIDYAVALARNAIKKQPDVKIQGNIINKIARRLTKYKQHIGKVALVSGLNSSNINDLDNKNTNIKK